ncbi:MAG: septal ring lytic transglycosylase RlpA family protein [Desulfuromonadales bacterium]|uniref:septal ring lytic transglycosylase RlpA family protein n=1 Tax=Desulfuromonas sp. KJ2020 TaxID=2919173 RepID=UPI0020A76B1F|nr:septal ring lytic transglycosylase RlpA family protein [Desulfuromonas sp. KJ2020]MCP3177519.1 septal ring lytic transglycosylase RlpA family protein [Desulfuromonas sp. KJ2020]
MSKKVFVVLGVLSLLAGCAGQPTYDTRVIDTPQTRELKGHQKPYTVNGERYDPLRSHHGFIEEGLASWYGKDFHGKKTSNGEIYDMYAMTAAHKTLPLGVYVRVHNKNNGRQTVVRVNDRGPFVKGRIIDLSFAAAKELEVVGPGTAPVRIEALGYQVTGSSGQVTYREPVSYAPASYAVQLGAFTQAENARRFAAELKNRYGVATVAESVVNGQLFYRVRVGRYASLPAAESAQRDFVAQGYGSGFIVAFD